MLNGWGKELILDCSDCNFESITSRENITNFLKQLVEDIDMVAFGAPQIIHFGCGDKEGFTATQLIETSNITGHFANDRKAVFLNIFSCRDFYEIIAIDLVTKYFKPKNIKSTILNRDA